MRFFHKVKKPARGESPRPESVWIHCVLAFPPSVGLNIPFLILWVECEITSRLLHVFSWLTTEVCTEIIKPVLFNFLFKLNSNISESALVRGKSGLLENSVFWRRGARNPCRLQKCGWGSGCGGGHWGWSSESENQEHFVLYLICSDKQLSTWGGPAWLSTSWSFQAGEVLPPLVPTAPGNSSAFSSCSFPLSLPDYTSAPPWDGRSLRTESVFSFRTPPPHHQISEPW